MEKINVTACVLKKEGTSGAGKAYKIFEVTCEKGKFDSFDELAVGEHDVEITPDTSGKGYNGKIKLVKAQGGFGNKVFTPKDTKRETALTCAVNSKMIPLVNADEILKLADKYLEWLKK